ncbi:MULTISPECIES: energy transducer TonB [Cyanophyceae]|uniref:energy transducer TonB n=1 Tax=Cyanophyceae TaxID=3028117 RepID=UPI0016830817|nr:MULTISPECIES: energy transducer TonB [Cyanophyceae]MBD1918256.1 TonB family protein [Phormidium sp. FACHB-77]MBD2031300.1 TonB family protein [Phormidium sp. FACHB-322]MBD2052367.1 TonB family protein [Leptolyngbya sp. FACHB-60]
MSLSNLCFEQHQQDQVKLRKLLLWGLLGSVGVHAIALGLSQTNLWQDADEANVLPIELIVTEPLVETPEPEVLDPTQPAELSTETNAPAAPAPTAPAPSPKAAVVTAPRPVAIAEPQIPEPAEPEPTEPEPVEPEPQAETEVESALEVPEEEDVPKDEEEETPEAGLPPETVEPEETTADADAEPTDPDLATAFENSSQFERLRDFLRSQREGEATTNAPGDGNPDSAGPAASGSTDGAETTAARPGTGSGTGTGSAETANPSGGGSGQGQGSRTVACQDCVRPDYPQSALDAGAEGQPMVSVDINPDGSVRSVTLTRSSGNPAIDQAAIQAARNSRFQPVNGGASVPIEYDLTIEGSRRNRDARRRGDRQAVELPPEATPTSETATTKPSPEPATTPTPPVDAAEPAAAPTPPSASESEPAEAEPVEPAATPSQPVDTNTTEPTSPTPAATSEPEPVEAAPPSPAAPVSPTTDPPAAPPPEPSAPPAPVAPPPAPSAPAPVAPPPANPSQPDTSSAE